MYCIGLVLYRALYNYETLPTLYDIFIVRFLLGGRGSRFPSSLYNYYRAALYCRPYIYSTVQALYI